jgi:hypothetical protein
MKKLKFLLIVGNIGAVIFLIKEWWGALFIVYGSEGNSDAQQATLLSLAFLVLLYTINFFAKNRIVEILLTLLSVGMLMFILFLSLKYGFWSPALFGGIVVMVNLFALRFSTSRYFS